MPDTNLFDPWIEECTPLVAIPGSLSVTSVGLGFEGAVVVVGDYLSNHRMRSIEKENLRGKERRLIQVMRPLKEVSIES
jgi:hypothetical protein